MSQTKAQLIDPVDGTIVNADINASAAIAGSKISPDFGSQNIVTTGTLTSGSASFSSAVTTSADVLSITGTSFADNEKIFTTFKRGTIHLGKLGVEVVGAGQAGNLLFETASSGTSAEHMRLDSNGKLLIGHNAVVFSSTAKFQLSGDGHHYLQVSRFTADANANRLRFFKSRSATVGTASTTSSGDQLGLVDFYGVDASNNSRVATSINGEMDGSSSTNTMPGRITFRTTPTTFSGTLERMRIDSSGRVGIGTTSPTRMLHIKSNAANSSQIALIDNDSTNEVFRVGQQSDGDGFLQLLDDSGAVQIGLEATGDSFFVGGKVGIGNSSPSFMLDVRGATEDTLRVGNTLESGHGTHNAKIVAGNTYYQDLKFQSSDVKFETYNGSSLGERFRVRNNGGVTFNGDTADANSLDDYEEGVWTPVYFFNSTSSGVTQPGTRNGKYTKIGNRVFFNCHISGTTGSHSGFFQIGGLPFNVSNDSSSNYSAFASWVYAGFDNEYQIIFRSNPGSNLIEVQRAGASVFSNEMTESGNYMITGHYKTDA